MNIFDNQQDGCPFCEMLTQHLLRYSDPTNHWETL